MRRVLLAIGLFALGFCQASYSREGLDRIEIFLHTVNVGDMIYNNFGHTAIRVKDPARGTDLVYNWGIFDFKDPLTFSVNYYKGNLIYKLGMYPYTNALRVYQYERRQVWEDRLNFSPAQKQLFLDKLDWNAQPENQDYAYQYFFDNCSTRPRNYIDDAIGGIIQSSTNISAHKSFRQMVRDGYQYNPSMDFLLEIGMNGNLDREMTRWESMFHPILLREELLKVENLGEPLIDQSKVLFQFPAPEGNPHIFKILAAILLVPLCFIVFFLQKTALQKYRKVPVNEHWERFGLRLLGCIGIPLTLVLGICGLLMPINWLFSGHPDLHHNLNMIFFLPFDLVFLVLSFRLLFKGKAYQCSSKSRKLFQRYIIFHLALLLAGALTMSSGGTGQDIGRVIYLAIPYLIVLSLMVNFGIVEGTHDHSKKAA